MHLLITEEHLFTVSLSSQSYQLTYCPHTYALIHFSPSMHRLQLNQDPNSFTHSHQHTWIHSLHTHSHMTLTHTVIYINTLMYSLTVSPSILEYMFTLHWCTATYTPAHPWPSLMHSNQHIHVFTHCLSKQPLTPTPPQHLIMHCLTPKLSCIHSLSQCAQTHTNSSMLSLMYLLTATHSYIYFLTQHPLTSDHAWHALRSTTTHILTYVTQAGMWKAADDLG